MIIINSAIYRWVNQQIADMLAAGQIVDDDEAVHAVLQALFPFSVAMVVITDQRYWCHPDRADIPPDFVNLRIRVLVLNQWHVLVTRKSQLFRKRKRQGLTEEHAICTDACQPICQRQAAHHMAEAYMR